PRSDGRLVVVLPGPPGELKRLWPNALETDAFRALLARTAPPGHRVVRMFGVSESAVAQALADAGGDGGGVEVTICARDFEIHVELYVAEGAQERADTLDAALRTRLGEHLFASDDRPIQEIVLALCRTQGLTLATA